MDERTGFIAAILANPDDDNVRLVFADWLQEQGEDDRAEFIRVQCELAKHTSPTCEQPVVVYASPWHGIAALAPRCGTCDACRWDVMLQKQLTPLCARERELLWAHWQHWRGLSTVGLVGCQNLATRPPIPPHKSITDVWFRRGFVSEITCSAESWLIHADTILAEQPVQKVELTTVPSMQSTRGGLYARLSGRTKELACGSGRTYEQMAPDLLRAEWSGIEFVLPPAYIDEFVEFTQSMHDDIVDALGVPPNLANPPG